MQVLASLQVRRQVQLLTPNCSLQVSVHTWCWDSSPPSKYSVKMWIIYGSYKCVWWCLGEVYLTKFQTSEIPKCDCREKAVFAAVCVPWWTVSFLFPYLSVFRSFPNCKFGDKCLYIHPNCKFDASCTRRDCPFTHASPRNVSSAIPAGNLWCYVLESKVNMAWQWTTSSEVDNCSLAHQVSQHLWNPKFHYHVHSSLTVDHNLTTSRYPVLPSCL